MGLGVSAFFFNTFFPTAGADKGGFRVLGLCFGAVGRVQDRKEGFGGSRFKIGPGAYWISLRLL